MKKKIVYRKLKRTAIVIGVIIAVFALYVEIVNRNVEHMSYRQKVLRAVYPALMWVNKITGTKSKAMENNKAVAPPRSFYDLSVELNNGSTLQLQSLKGKKVLLVNTASNCGYTDQYAALQSLYEQYNDQLVVIGFPANDFKEQEKGSDEEIAAFCKVNYGVSFPLAKKSGVLKNAFQNPVFRWLSDRQLNGWNEQEPTWNFSKYLVNEEGMLTNYFDPGISPLGKEVIHAITEK